MNSNIAEMQKYHVYIMITSLHWLGWRSPTSVAANSSWHQPFTFKIFDLPSEDRGLTNTCTDKLNTPCRTQKER